MNTLSPQMKKKNNNLENSITTLKSLNDCHICKIHFSLLKKTKYLCDKCKGFVCKKCSTKEINNKKWCDFCYFKYKLHEEDYLKRKESEKLNLKKLQQKKKTIDRKKEEFNEKDIKLKNLRIQIEQESLKNDKIQFELHNEELKIEQTLSKRLEQNKDLSHICLNNEKILLNKKTQTLKLDEDLISIKSDYEYIQSSLDLKKNELLLLLQKKKKIEESKTFIEHPLVKELRENKKIAKSSEIVSEISHESSLILKFEQNVTLSKLDDHLKVMDEMKSSFRNKSMITLEEKKNCKGLDQIEEIEEKKEDINDKKPENEINIDLENKNYEVASDFNNDRNKINKNYKISSNNYCFKNEDNKKCIVF